MSLLRILAATSESAPLRWVRIDPQYEILENGGESTLEAQDDDTACELIIPAGRSSHIPLKVSPEQLSRLTDDNLQWLVEPHVSQEIGQLHLVRGDVEDNEILPVFAVDRNWLSSTISNLATRHIRPERILLETLLVNWQPKTWSVVIKPEGGFVRTGEQSALILDSLNNDIPPLVLQMALQEHPEPTKILIYQDNPMSGSCFSAWETAVGVPICLAGSASSHWQQAHPHKTIDLAKGLFTPQGKVRNIARRMKLSGWLLLGIIIINTLGAGTRTILNTLEKQRLERQIQSVLLETFPATTAILDPLMQMQKGVDQNTRTAGVLSDHDFLPLLQNINGVIGKQVAGKIDAVGYEADKGIELTLRETTLAEQAADLLKSAGFSTQIDASAPGTTRLRVRIAP